MIAKITKGRNFKGLLDYLYREGEAEAHTDSHVVAGNLIGDDPDVLAEELQASATRNPNVNAPVWHASLRLAPGEQLSDEEWRLASQRFLREMHFLAAEGDGFGPQDAPYVVVRHADDHVHLVVCRVRGDGSVVRDSHDWRRSHAACRVVEREHGLSDASQRIGRGEDLANVSKGERLAAARRGVEPDRARLRRLIEEARDNCDGTREGFEAEVRARGGVVRANQGANGRMSGYAFSLAGWHDPQGEQVWLGGSKVHRNLRWSQLDHDLAQRRTRSPEPAHQQPEQQPRSEWADEGPSPEPERKQLHEGPDDREQAHQREREDRGEQSASREDPARQGIDEPAPEPRDDHGDRRGEQAEEPEDRQRERRDQDEQLPIEQTVEKRDDHEPERRQRQEREGHEDPGSDRQSASLQAGTQAHHDHEQREECPESPEDRQAQPDPPGRARERRERGPQPVQAQAAGRWQARRDRADESQGFEGRWSAASGSWRARRDHHADATTSSKDARQAERPGPGQGIDL